MPSPLNTKYIKIAIIHCHQDAYTGKAVVKILVSGADQELQEITVVFQNESQSVIATTEDTVFTALKLLPYPGDSNGKEIGYQLQVSKKGIKF